MFLEFWRQHPALLYAIGLLIGVGFALQWHLGLCLPLLFIGVPFFMAPTWQDFGRFAIAVAFALVGVLFIVIPYQFPELPEGGAAGTAYFEIESISTRTTYFGKQWVYRGMMRLFESDDGLITGRRLPFTLRLSQKNVAEKPSADQLYVLRGWLREVRKGYYAFKPAKEALWHSVKASWNLAEWRFYLKQHVSHYIASHISHPKAATFLSGLVTGEFDDRMITFAFSRFGLQHIMAISGFHFAIIAAILNLFLSLCLRRDYAMTLLMTLLTLYFVFLGSSPSIMRAWVTILIALFGTVIGRQTSALNSLGIAMIVVLFVDPLSCLNIGFQFSFAVTAAILLLSGGFDRLWQSLFAKRSLSEMVEMNVWNQHAYCFLSFFRQGFALTCAVNCVALPLTLFYFQQFPVMSVLFNLFFPFLVSICMLLLLVAFLVTPLLPFIATAIHSFNTLYTEAVLRLTSETPISLDIVWQSSFVTAPVVMIALCSAFMLGIYFSRGMTSE